MTPRLLGLATARPPYEISQDDIAAAARLVFADRFSGYDRMARVFSSAGIERRRFVRPIEWFLDAPRGWEERSAAYLDGACELFVEAGRRALEIAGVKASEIDIVVTVSSTGIATPSIEARVAGRMGFRSDVERVPIFGLGCAGGVSGLGTAARLCGAAPGTTVLLVALEACSLSYRPDDLSKASIVATALFGDGAAACVLRNGDVGLARIESSAQHLWPDTLDIMGWRVEAEGLGVIFDRAIPPFAEANMDEAVTTMLAQSGLTKGDIDRFVCHPGGAKVVEALETSLGLSPGSLDVERQVLAANGNMSAPTVLFVLEEMLARGLPDRIALLALGPGFTASCVTMRGGSA